MTSLLPAPRRTTRDDARSDAAHRRPLVILGVLAGVTAACATLVVCLATGVIGWFLTDAGAHGAPRDGLRVGATGWLMAHGSGVHVAGAHVTAVPLGLTLLAGFVVWRLGLRLGDSVSGHGPDADAIADGVRDWTVAAASRSRSAPAGPRSGRRSSRSRCVPPRQQPGACWSGTPLCRPPCSSSRWSSTGTAPST
jgi:hypothetical protein